MSTSENMIAGAPISWGVCEVPGWGYQLPPDRVLTEMRDIGLAATELGPEGFLPAAPEAMADMLSRYRLHAIGGFTPLLLHRPDHDPLREVIEVLERYAATGARTLVLSADSGLAGYDTRPDLGRAGLGHPADQPGSDRCRCRRARCARGAPSTCRNDDRERRGGAAGARGLLDLPVPGHRSPAHRWHGSSRTCPARTPPNRPYPYEGRRRRPGPPGAVRAAHLHRGGP